MLKGQGIFRLAATLGSAAVCILAALPPALAQQSMVFSTVKINSSPNPVGSGARAIGMGGAFIAVADDATAASWNPGGLVQLEKPEFSFALTFDHRRLDLDSDPHPEAAGVNEVYRQDLNYCSFALPFQAFDKNMVVSLNYQRLYDFYDDLSFDQNIESVSSSGVFTSLKTHTEFSQSGALKAFSPAWAIQLTPRFSIGAAFNIWTDNLGYDNGWHSTRITTGQLSLHAPPAVLSKVSARQVYREKNENFEGFNLNLGLLWHLSRVVTLGAVIKTPFTADVDRKTYLLTENRPAGPLPPALGFGAVPVRTRESIRMHFPLSYGLGIALRLSDVLTLAGDVYRTEWDDFWVKAGGRTTNPITGQSRSRSHVHSTTQVRLGCEYLFVLEKTIVPLRLGAFYDPEPSRKNPDDFFGLTVGSGMLIGPVVLDCAYMYRWGRSVKGDVVEIPGTDADVDQHSIYVSMIYHF